MAADTSPTAIFTLCPECKGQGAVVIRRAALNTEGEAEHGFDGRDCPMCLGQEWFPGLIGPA